MPGFTTHYLFGNETKKQIQSLQVKQLISKYEHCYQLGLQGPDVFFYYLPAYFITKRNVGNLMHDTATLDFFESMLDVRNHLSTPKARAIADAYIYGFIGHYTLDTNCHPYIYARSHYLENKDNKTYDFGCHVSLETDIDKSLLWHFKHIIPSKFTPGETIHVDSFELTVLSIFLARAIRRTYPDNSVTTFRVRQAARFMRYENNWMHDPHGIKKYLVRKIEQLILGHGFISTMIPSDKFYKYPDCLNLTHKGWKNPWNTNLTYHESFYDLMDKATESYLHRIELYRKCVLEKDHRSLDDICLARNEFLSDLGDCSYLSGYPLD